MTKEGQLAYSRPQNPDAPDWDETMLDWERRLVRSQQVHACTTSTCLRMDRKGEDGSWKPKRSYGCVNSYCPTVTTALRCDNDIKLMTNGEDTKDATWYQTAYQTKKEGMSFNMSALMTQALMYHEQHSDYLSEVIERNRLLLYRCMHTINREAKLSGAQVISYLLGWGDSFRSHHYTPLYWSSMEGRLVKQYPELRKRSQTHVSSSVGAGVRAAEQDSTASGLSDGTEPPVVPPVDSAVDDAEAPEVVTFETNLRGQIFARS
ncbi:hypothetical protein PLICRDRAFT_175678 [Plicaturopsis crispa FD-325 SS-3]|nr:hypothetical protein PLICRDRAFT_175678 [Plicaturopsis crispa FD-325 SS-3]